MANKEDFILVTRADDNEVLVNINQVKFIVEGVQRHCHFFFGGGEDDFITIKVGLEEFLDLI